MHTPPPIGHQAAKWGVKYNFHECWRLLIKHFPLQLPSASYSLAFDTPCPLPPLKGPPLHRGEVFSVQGKLKLEPLLALLCSDPQ